MCTGVSCEGIRGGFANSLLIALPSTAIAIALGALNGYALAFWRVRGAQLLFALLMLGAFVPLQVMIYPLVRVTAMLHVFGTLPGIVLVHVIFSMPVMTLLFRNYYADGAGGALQCRACRRRPLSGAPSARRPADVGTDHRRGFDHAGDWRMERLPARTRYSQGATICR